MERNSLEDFIARLLKDRIICSNGCWTTNSNMPYKDGYIRVSFNNKKYLIHRISAAYYHNLDLEDENKLSLHKDECPDRSCWNPEHIYVGSHSDNTRDFLRIGSKRGTISRERKVCPRGHSFNEENTYHYKGTKRCKICIANAVKRYRNKSN